MTWSAISANWGTKIWVICYNNICQQLWMQHLSRFQRKMNKWFLQITIHTRKWHLSLKYHSWIFSALNNLFVSFTKPSGKNKPRRCRWFCLQNRHSLFVVHWFNSELSLLCIVWWLNISSRLKCLVGIRWTVAGEVGFWPSNTSSCRVFYLNNWVGIFRVIFSQLINLELFFYRKLDTL